MTFVLLPHIFKNFGIPCQETENLKNTHFGHFIYTRTDFCLLQEKWMKIDHPILPYRIINSENKFYNVTKNGLNSIASLNQAHDYFLIEADDRSCLLGIKTDNIYAIIPFSFFKSESYMDTSYFEVLEWYNNTNRSILSTYHQTKNKDIVISPFLQIGQPSSSLKDKTPHSKEIILWLDSLAYLLSCISLKKSEKPQSIFIIGKHFKINGDFEDFDLNFDHYHIDNNHDNVFFSYPHYQMITKVISDVLKSLNPTELAGVYGFLGKGDLWHTLKINPKNTPKSMHSHMQHLTTFNRYIPHEHKTFISPFLQEINS
jgi:hypothetical protein